MFLKKNFWGLFFFLCWGISFSQQEQLVYSSSNINIDAPAFSESAFTTSVDNSDRVYAILQSIIVQDWYVYEGDEYKEAYELLYSLTSNEKKSDRFVINVLNINSKYSDYAPCFYKDELVFSSSRSTNSFLKIVDDLNNQPFLDLYRTTKEEKKSIIRLNGVVNSKFHESSPAFSPDGKIVYFTSNNYVDQKSGTNTEGKVLLKTYRAFYKADGEWEDIEELPFNSDEYSVAHPAVSPDGRFLFFASDMPGSLGKSDLYVVDIHPDGTFGTPLNLGDAINTEGRETFPYISDKGNLFFASDGHVGLGGLDIFKVMPDLYGRLQVYNVGEPINSEDDDFTFIINEKKKVGYFASNRKGGEGDDDIYGFHQLVAFPDIYYPQLKGTQKYEKVIELQPYQEDALISGMD